MLDNLKIDLTDYETPLFSKKKVKKAGEKLVIDEVDDDVLSVLNNWRSAHALPLDAISFELNQISVRADESALLAKRLKRSPSIINKLKLQKNMSLARMQDIGGCRAILSSIDNVYKAKELFEQKMQDVGHELIRTDNYIQRPKKSGYRGIHLVYKYNGSDTSANHNGMMVEAQIRTRFQHYWATAVETMGAYLKQSLKSSQGDKQILGHFSRLGDLFAYYEGQPLYEQKIAPRHLAVNVMIESEFLQVQKKLMVYSFATKFIEDEIEVSDNEENADYYLVITDILKGTVRVKSVYKEELKAANEEYTRLEQHFKYESGKDIALVSAKTLSELRDTYPNYFSDTQNFSDHYSRVVSHAVKSGESGVKETKSRYEYMRQIRALRVNTKRSIKKNMSKNRSLLRRKRMITRNLRKTTNLAKIENLREQLDLISKDINAQCRRVADVRNFYSNDFRLVPIARLLVR
ncbi:RelA/SpoT domain-containing protein [Vibrio antiquarius]